MSPSTSVLRAARAASALAAASLVCVAACGSLDPATGATAPACSNADSNPAVSVSFAQTIRPWMDRYNDDPVGHGCRACHYPGEEDPLGIELGGLDLSTLGALRRGGVTSGTNIVVPGKPCDSALVQKLRGVYVPAPVRMPKDGPPYWPNSWVQAVSDWIAEGAQGGDGE